MAFALWVIWHLVGDKKRRPCVEHALWAISVLLIDFVQTVLTVCLVKVPHIALMLTVVTLAGFVSVL